MAKKPQFSNLISQNLDARRRSSGLNPVDMGARHEKIPIDRIDRNPWQPRLKIGVEEIGDLARSIAESGQIEPIVVRPKDDRFELIAGERRWLAHQHLNRSHIEAVIRHVDDSQMPMLALVENMQREDLTDYEVGVAVAQATGQFKYKKDMADYLGIDRKTLYRYLAYQDLPRWVLDKLDETPNLLNRFTADDLKVFLKEADPETHREAIMTGLERVRDGSLAQIRFIQFLRDYGRLRPTKPNSIVFEHEGKPVGTLKSDSKRITLQINRTVLSDDKRSMLEEFVRGLIR